MGPLRFMFCMVTILIIGMFLILLLTKVGENPPKDTEKIFGFLLVLDSVLAIAIAALRD